MNLTHADYLALAPLLTLFITALLLLVYDGKKYAATITLLGLATGLSFSLQPTASTNAALTPWLVFDGLASFFTTLFLAIGIVMVGLTSGFFKQFSAPRTEFYFFLLASLFGLILIASANDFLTIFIGLETLSIALYVLCCYMKTWPKSHEASFKYFLLSSISTSLLLFGIALIYGATGSTKLSLPAHHIDSTLFLAGLGLVTVSLLFKIAAFPFHVWAPDVYAGASTPVTAFMAVGTKAGAFSALIRIALFAYSPLDPIWHNVVALLAVPTLIFANFVALKQVEMRRFFAYSGISHAGFLLIPLAASGPEAASSMLFYIVVYTVATLVAFSSISSIDTNPDGVTLADLKGLFMRAPFRATSLTLSLLTLGGIPPLVGFFAKFYVLKVAFAQGYYTLVIVGLLTTILAAFYYLRIVTTLFQKDEAEKPLPAKSYAALATTLVLTLTLIIASCYPELLITISS